MDEPGLPVIFPALFTLTREPQWETSPCGGEYVLSFRHPALMRSAPLSGEKWWLLFARGRGGGLGAWGAGEAYGPDVLKLQPGPP